MPIKKDGTGKRWVEMEILVPGTPEQVWQAMATGPGSSAWFVKTEIEPRVGGALKFDFGEGAVAAGEVTTWEPPQKFGYEERDWAPDARRERDEVTRRQPIARARRIGRERSERLRRHHV